MRASSSLRRLWLPTLIGAGWLATCYLLVIVFSATDPPASTPSAGGQPRLDSGTEAPADDGVTYRARIEIRDTKASLTTGWIDLEVTGVAGEAEAACRALAAREQGLTYPAPLSVILSNPCSTSSLPDHPPGVTGGVGLIQPMPASRLDVALAGGGRGESLTRMRHTMVGAYADQASCARALAVLTDRQANAAGRARQDVDALLDGKITTWRSRVEQACRTGGSDRECGTSRALLARLEARRTDPSPADPDGLEEPSCRSLQAP